MRIRQVAIASSLLFLSFQLSAGSNPDRKWQTAQVQQVQRVPNLRNPGDHWEYVLTSNGFVYTLRNGGNDAPYLNSSLGSEVKIAPTANDSNHPFDGDDLNVMDAKGKEHKMDLVSVSITDAGCKK